MAGFGVLYLHGFLSSGQSLKGQWFKEKVRESRTFSEKKAEENPLITKWLTPTYPIQTVSRTLTSIEAELQRCFQDKQTDWILAGSSMGGFYAQHFAHTYRLPFIMINPALNPEFVFKDHFGDHINPATQEPVSIDQAYVAELNNYVVSTPDRKVSSLLLLDTDDEIIDVNYVLQQYGEQCGQLSKTSRAKIFCGGDHSFIHLDNAWDEIRQFLAGLEYINK